MARNLDSTMSSNLASTVVRPAFFVKFEFDYTTTPGDNDLRLWTGSDTISYDSENYIGLGNLVNLEMPTESQDGSAQAVTFTLSGLPSTNTSLAMTEQYQNRPVTCWFATMSDATTISGTPYKIFEGLIDVMEVSDNGQTASISVKTEGFAYGVGPCSARRTEQDQKERYSSDASLRFVADLAEKEFRWGVKA